MNVPWYEREEIRDSLILFGRAIQGIAPYQVVIEPDPLKCHSGCCSFDEKKISVNPTIFKVPETEQYQLTKALLVHEAGHRRYTTPSVLPAIVREIANILEDERVESRMWTEFVGVRWLLRMLADGFYREATPIDKSSDRPHEVVSYFLKLRWARRINQPVNGGLSENNQLLWERVEPLVYESWQAANSTIVSRNAGRIAEMLSIVNTNSKRGGV